MKCRCGTVDKKQLEICDEKKCWLLFQLNGQKKLRIIGFFRLCGFVVSFLFTSAQFKFELEDNED